MGRAHRRALANDTVRFGEFTEAGPGYLTPSSQNEKHYFWRSNWTHEGVGPGGVEVIYGTYPGSDSNDGLSPQTPVATIRRLRQVVGEVSDGAKVIVHMADARSPNNGFDGGIACENLYYQFEDLFGSSTIVHENSVCFMGPPKLRIIKELGTLHSSGVDGTHPAALTTATFVNDGYGIDAWGMYAYFCVRENDGNSNPAFFMPQLPLRNSTAADGNGRSTFYICDGGVGGAIGLPADGHYYIGRSGVVCETVRDYDNVVFGIGSYRAGGQQKGGTDAEAQNPRPKYWGIEFSGPWTHGFGSSFDTCNGLDHIWYVSGGNFEMKNCRIAGGLFIQGGSGRLFGFRNNTHGNTTNREYGCYQHQDLTLSDGTVLPGNRMTNKYIGCDVLLAQKSAVSPSPGMYIGAGQIAPGDAEGGCTGGHHSGEYLAYWGIYGYGLNTPMVMVDGSSKFAMVDNCSFQGHNLLNVGFHLLGNASVEVFDAGVRFTGTAPVADIRIGLGEKASDPIVDTSLGDFRDASKWNKNLCIYRPYTPANRYGVGIPATDLYPYGCQAQMRG